MRSPRAKQQLCRPSLGTRVQARQGLCVPLTQAGDPPLGILLCAVTGPATTPPSPATLIPVRIFTVFSRLPRRGRPGGCENTPWARGPTAADFPASHCFLTAPCGIHVAVTFSRMVQCGRLSVK